MAYTALVTMYCNEVVGSVILKETCKNQPNPRGPQYAGTAVGGHEIHILSLVWDMSFETY